MNVKELIEELKKYPEDMKVITTDYKYGDDEVESVDTAKYDYWRNNIKYTEDVVKIT